LIFILDFVESFFDRGKNKGGRLTSFERILIIVRDHAKYSVP